MKKLSGSEARALRARGSKLEASATIGKRGLTEENVNIINDAFLKQDLVKITIRKSAFENPKEEIEKIAKQFEAIIVQKLGSSLLLFKLSSED
jgi:RNA-binding protein